MSDLLKSIPSYESFKDTGEEWIEFVPQHWEVVPTRAIFAERNEKNNGPKTDHILSVTKDRGVIPYDEKGAIGNNKSEEIERYKLVYENDLVINKMNVVIGSLGLSKYFGALSQVYIVLCPRTSDVNISFYSYMLRNEPFYKSLIKYCTGIMELRESLDKDEFKKLPLPFPPLQEQTAIATFLNRKTAQIEQAVNIKERQIALLKERKQILIQNTVTRGLNPDVPMRDSGVEWIGDIPAHWDLIYLKRLTHLIQTGPFGTQLHAYDYVDGRVPLVNPKHMKDGGIVPESNCSVDEKTVVRLDKYKLRHNDLIMARRGELGRCAVVSKKETGWLCGTGSLMIRLDPKRMNPFYTYLVVSGPGVAELLSLDSVGSTMDNLNASIIGNLLLPVPPIEEQASIVAHIKTQSNKIDKTKSLLEQQIAKLKEYKATLINSAVTGKIKVPGVVEPACKETKEEEVA